MNSDEPREMDFHAALNPNAIAHGEHLIPGLPPEYTNRKPLNFEGRFLWHPQSKDDRPGYYRDHLPLSVFMLLRGMMPRENPKVHNMVRAYHTEEAAQMALRDAIAEAKRL